MNKLEPKRGAGKQSKVKTRRTNAKVTSDGPSTVDSERFVGPVRRGNRNPAKVDLAFEESLLKKGFINNNNGKRIQHCRQTKHSI